jgi:hypothetical protein
MKYIYRIFAILTGAISLGISGSLVMWVMAYILSNGGNSYPIENNISLTNWLLCLILISIGYQIVKESNLDVY